MMQRLSIGFAVLCAVGFLYGIHADLHWLRLLTKPVPVLILLGWVWTQGHGPARRWIALGLGLSIGGDILLEVGEHTFLPGLVSFLLGHVAFIAGYLSQERRLMPLRAVLPYTYGAAVFAWLQGGLGPMKGPVLAYVLVICTMLWRAASLVGTPVGLLALAGAVSFAFSDTLIAVNRFHTPLWWARPVIILTYWAGQTGIAASVVLRRAAPAD